MLRFAVTIASALALFAIGSKAATWATWNPSSANCTDACQPTLQSRFRFCIEDATGGKCGASSAYVEVTACGCAAPQWGAWGAWGTCNMTCGACGRETRTRDCVIQTGCPAANCTGNATEENTTPCGLTDPIPICNFPNNPCCTGYKSQMNTTMKKYVCVPV